jgi:hypothetical protein
VLVIVKVFPPSNFAFLLLRERDHFVERRLSALVACSGLRQVIANGFEVLLRGPLRGCRFRCEIIAGRGVRVEMKGLFSALPTASPSDIRSTLLYGTDKFARSSSSLLSANSHLQFAAFCRASAIVLRRGKEAALESRDRPGRRRGRRTDARSGDGRWQCVVHSCGGPRSAELGGGDVHCAPDRGPAPVRMTPNEHGTRDRPGRRRGCHTDARRGDGR